MKLVKQFFLILIFSILSVSCQSSKAPLKTIPTTPSPSSVGQKKFDALNLKMVKIKKGSFLMGCAGGKICNPRDKPTRRVSVKPFSISTTEVTFAQWDACVAAGGCSYKPKDAGWGRGQRPVINVSWDDAQQFVAWLRRLTGENYRLPTEAEWEYAARAGTTTLYSWGDQAPSCSKTAKNGTSHDGGKYSDCYKYVNSKYKGRGTELVASYSPNPWGLYDMHGNVAEWTCSAYVPKYDGTESKCSNNKNITMMARGGSWSQLSTGLNWQDRHGYDRDSRFRSFGFRVIKTH